MKYKKQDKEHLIYKFTFPNGGIYIGETINIFNRFRRHWYNSSKKKYKEYNYPINRAIRKYGWENVKKEILVTNIPFNSIRNIETFWIRYYKYFLKRKVYNLRDVSEAHQPSLESIKKMSFNGSERGKKGEKSSSAKKVFQINKSTGKIIKEWGSIIDASRILKIRHTHISGVCKKKDRRKTTGGFIWVYKSQYSREDIKKRVEQSNIRLYKGTTPKPLRQIDRNTNKVLKEFKSIKEASEISGIPACRISSVCNGYSPLSYGFKWEFINEI